MRHRARTIALAKTPRALSFRMPIWMWRNYFRRGEPMVTGRVPGPGRVPGGAEGGVVGQGGGRLCVVDSTALREPGGSGTAWRVHYLLDFPSLGCLAQKVSDVHTGESLHMFDFVPGQVVLADRNYGYRAEIAHVVGQGADIVARMALSALPLHDASGGPGRGPRRPSPARFPRRRWTISRRYRAGAWSPRSAASRCWSAARLFLRRKGSASAHMPGTSANWKKRAAPSSRAREMGRLSA